MRQHLARERGNVTPCEDVPEDVNVRIQQHLGFEVLEKLRKQKEANPAKNSYFPYFQDKGGDDDDARPLQKMATRGRGKEVLEGTSNRTKRHKKQHLQMVVPVVARPLLQKCMRSNIDPTSLEVMGASMGDWVEDLEATEAEELSWLDVTITSERINHDVQNTDDSNESTDNRSSDLTKGLDGDDDLYQPTYFFIG
ncbi:DNA binding protein [Salix suchowensis]|nr:DNA binding protein [Salix suchowensis]